MPVIVFYWSSSQQEVFFFFSAFYVAQLKRFVSSASQRVRLLNNHASFFRTVILGSPLPSTTSDPVNQPKATSSSIEDTTSKSPRPSFRVAKAIGLYPQTNTAVVLDRHPITTVTSAPLERASTAVEASIIRESVELSFRGNTSNVEPAGTTVSQSVVESIERVRNTTAKKDSKITWILTTNKSGRPKYDQENQSSRNVSFEEVEDLTVLPLQDEMSKADLMLNRSAFMTSLSAAGNAGNAAIRTFNRSEDDVEIDEEVTQHFATAASILEGEPRDILLCNEHTREQCRARN